MTMLRTLVILLVLANLLFLLVGRGLFGGSGGGEPGRLSAQIDPQKIRVVAPGEPVKPSPPREQPAATSEAAAADRAPDVKPAEDKTQAPAQPGRCVAVAGLSAAQVAALKDKLGSEQALMLRDRSPEGSTWWVSLPPLSDREAAIARAEEMRTRGVADAFVIREEGEQRNAVSLGLFKNEAAAEDFRRQLESKGINGARVSARVVPGARHALDISGPATRVDEVVELALAANSAARRTRCVQR